MLDPTPEVTPEVIDLLHTGQTRLAELRTAHQAKRAAVTAENQRQTDARIATLRAAATALLPEALHGYLTLPDDLNNTPVVSLDVPGCAPIYITFDSHSHWDKDRTVFDYTPRQHSGHPLYEVVRYKLVHSDDDGWVVTDWTGYYEDPDFGHDDLDIALALAGEMVDQRVRLQHEASQKNAADEISRQARQSLVAQREQAAEDARLSLITKILDDDLALRLVELFLAIQSDRENWVSTVQDAAENADEVAERYEHRLAEKQREADRAIRSVKDDADRAQREADDLQSQLDRIKRQAQFA